MIAVVDYGVGNLYSIKRSLDFIGAECEITSDAKKLNAADKIILPGVGAFGDAAARLEASGLGQVVVSQATGGKPLLGICLGMQLLFEKSYEYGTHSGLGLLAGEVGPLFADDSFGLKVPQMGWNALKILKDTPLTKYISNGDYVYFVHSYAATKCESSLIATTNYGVEVTAIAGHGNVYGTQFHPEKSGRVGLNILRAFCELSEG